MILEHDQFALLLIFQLTLTHYQNYLVTVYNVYCSIAIEKLLFCMWALSLLVYKQKGLEACLMDSSYDFVCEKCGCKTYVVAENEYQKVLLCENCAEGYVVEQKNQYQSLIFPNAQPADQLI